MPVSATGPSDGSTEKHYEIAKVVKEGSHGTAVLSSFVILHIPVTLEETYAQKNVQP